MELRKICSFALLCAVAVGAMAIPARRDGMLRTAEDGTQKTVFLHGDESFHYMTDAEGNWLDENTLMPLSDDIKAARSKAGQKRLQARRAKQETGKDRLLAPRGAVILVSFSDVEFQSSNAAMTQWAMGDTYTYRGATGSIRRYFLDQSWGAYDLNIDVYGPVTVSNTAAYYGQNGSDGYDLRPHEMVKEACTLAEAQGADFSRYDYNNDGDVDWVVILYAGKGEADGGSASTIWPHQDELYYNSFYLNGKRIDHYCCLNEIDGTTGARCGIGTFCHEFSHIMGLPDFYSTDGGEHKTMGNWDILDSGAYLNNGNTPPAYSAYERWWMGWFKPRLINSACKVLLPDLTDYQSACFMTETGADIDDILSPNPKIFYLFENRQQVGWDTYIPAEGMLVTRIAFSSYKWRYNIVNNDAENMGIDLMEADGLTPTRPSYYDNGYSGKAGDLYPLGATEFTAINAFQVTNITLSNQIITFQVNGGSKIVNLDIDEVPSVDTQSKFIRDGRIIIVRDGKQYDILGNRL